MSLYDFHCHLGFFPHEGDAGAAAEAALAGVDGFFNCTVTPEEYVGVLERFAGDARVVTAPGLHPWYLAGDAEVALAQADAVCGLIRSGSPVGEIGLDFGPRHTGTREVQTEAFRRIVARAAEVGECVLSLHSVQASETVLDILEGADFFSRGTAIFHWYSGSSAHLSRALADGARFSLNPRMLLTKRGREYARIIPVDRLLTETDFPAEDGICPEPVADALTRLIAGVAELRGMDSAALEARIGYNSRELFARMAGSGAVPAGCGGAVPAAGAVKG
ncbi:MAG: TatD family hydrolase [Eggerthellaceae bacterium]|nr:TatD family hydrolase [Eggerthellaceae bacterium]